MPKFRHISVFGILCLCWVLCLGQIPLPEQQAFATLKIYQKGYMRSGFGLRINGQQVIERMKTRSWLEVQVPAGELILETVPEFRYPTYEGKSFSLTVEEGKVYYLEAIVDYEFFVSRMYLALREKEQAEKEINRFKKEKNALSKVE